MTRVDVSVIIVNWNTREFLSGCLNSLYKKTRDITVEVIVIDNGSQDASLKMLENSGFPGIRIIRNHSNVGFSRACNQGLRESRGDKILLLNSDTIIVSNILKEMADFLDQHPEAGIAGPMLLNEDGSYQKSSGKMRSIVNEAEEKLIRWGLAKELGVIIRMEEERRRQVHSTDWISGAFLMIKRSVMTEIGLLDERMFLHFEDIDWCIRAGRNGWKILYNPFLQAIHLNGKSMSRNPTRSFIEYRRSQMIFYYTYYGSGPETMLLRLFLLLKALLGILFTETAGLKKNHLPGDALKEKKKMYRELLRLVLKPPPRK